MAGAPGWYVVRRKSRRAVLFERLLKRQPRLRLVALGGAAGVAVLLLAFPLVRAYWESPTERSRTSSMPPVASSPDTAPEESPAASAEAPPIRPEPAPVADGQGSRGQQDGSATAARQAKPDPAPPHDAAAARPTSREGSAALTPQVQSRPRPLAAGAQSQSPVGGTPSRVQLPEPAARQPPPSAPQPAASRAKQAATAPAELAGETSSSPNPPAEPAPTATAQVIDGTPSSPDPSAEPAPSVTAQVAGEAPASGDRPVPPASEIRVFIHHTADRGGDAALAEQLAEHLRGQGLTVADIRPVDFSIGKASVRYFFEDDRSASERLVEELGRFFERAAARAPDQASDFTHFTPKPRPGNVEVWLPAS